MKLEIKELTTDDFIYIDTLTNWLYNWWGIDENYTKESIKCMLEHTINKNDLPKTYIMLENNTLIGMYQFLYDDLDIRPDLYPWLSNVFIDPTFRGKGYSKVLLNSVYNNALKSNLKELYLYTTHTNFYEKFNFTYLGTIDTFKTKDRIQRLYNIKIK
ncbi:MAG: GNAT family N-acetyltransferase [Bacilli bacterium]